MTNKTNEEYKWYSGKYDRCFKEVMLKEKNKDLLKLLIEHILKIEIYDIKINNVEKLRENIHIKGIRTDISMNTNIGYINLEVNSNPEEYVHPRNFSYLADYYSHDILVGEEYDENIMYIQINLSYGFMLTDKNKIKKQPIDIEPIREYYMMDKTGKVFIKNFIIYEINMDYYLNLWYTKNEQELEKEKVLVMLGLDKNSLEKLSENDKVVSRYMKEVNNVNKDPEFREYISYEEDQRKIQNTLLRKTKEEIVKGLLKNGTEIEVIINSTGISKKRIEEIAKELNIEPKFREYIRYEEDQRKIQNTLLEKAEKQGIEKGRNEGVNSEKIEIARGMLNKKFDVDTIIELTNLTKEEIEKLK